MRRQDIFKDERFGPLIMKQIAAHLWGKTDDLMSPMQLVHARGNSPQMSAFVSTLMPIALNLRDAECIHTLRDILWDRALDDRRSDMVTRICQQLLDQPEPDMQAIVALFQTISPLFPIMQSQQIRLATLFLDAALSEGATIAPAFLAKLKVVATQDDETGKPNAHLISCIARYEKPPIATPR